MEKYLQSTYGIIVYQEQLMMLSRLIADFSRRESDLLRKALCKKKTNVLSILKPKFIEGGIKNGHKKNAVEKVWNEIERKGKYFFNKSHAVCYTWLAYQMAFLKANYPSEFKKVMDEYASR
jgi:DNA polymerase-3 subunit alpha